MPPAASDPTMSLCSGELNKACENGLISNICGENILFYIQNMAEMEWSTGMLDTHSDFPSSCFNRTSDRQFGRTGQMCVEQE